MKVKLLEINKHRNETTFRPYYMFRKAFKTVGIDFITEGNNYDYAWVGQASIADKKLSLDESVSRGLEFLNNINTPYMILDGQDSASLIGVYEVFKESRADLLLKNTLYKDWNDYKKPSVNGRTYWDEQDSNYSCEDIDEYKSKISLSGTNWLSTVQPQWQNIDYSQKDYDICALFGYKGEKQNYEHGLFQNKYYDLHRELCHNQLDRLEEKGYKVARLSNKTEKLPPQEYYNLMARSKIVLAPFGYGEMAPRDIEANMFCSTLIKPSMSHLVSNPMWYEDNVTYLACEHDFSDLEDKVKLVLEGGVDIARMINKGRQRFSNMYSNPTSLVKHVYEQFIKLEEIEYEEV